MAVLFSQTKNNKHYEVRSAGNSVRLYSNGVFHSQFNAQAPFMGHVWDLMALPALELPPHKALKVLLLGVGGGAVIRQLQALYPGARITGVDIDPMHLRLARSFFGVGGRAVKLVAADAVLWVKENRSARFDLIIDDLFGDDTATPGQPERAVALTPEWIRRLSTLLGAGGRLVFNTEAPTQITQLALAARDAGSPYCGLRALTLNQYQNAVAVLSRDKIKTADFYSLLNESPFKLPRKNGRLVYRCKDCSRFLAY